MPSFKASVKAVRKTIVKAISQPFKLSWAKVRRGRSASETSNELEPAAPSDSAVPPPSHTAPVLSIPALVDGGDAETHIIQVAVPVHTGTRSSLSSSIPPATTSPTPALPPARHDSPRLSYSRSSPHIPTAFIVSPAGVDVQRSSLSGAPLSSGASYGSDGASQTGASGNPTGSLYESRYQTSIEASVSLSLLGNRCIQGNTTTSNRASPSTVDSSFSVHGRLTGYAVDLEWEVASSLRASVGSAVFSQASIDAPESALSSTGARASSPRISEDPLALILVSENVQTSRRSSGGVPLSRPSPLVPGARLPSNPMYKKVNGTIQMPSEDYLVKFADTKKPIQATIPTPCALVLPLEHKPMPRGPRLAWDDVKHLGSGTFGSVVLQSRCIRRSDGTYQDELTAVKHSNWIKHKAQDSRVYHRLMPRMEYAVLKKLAGAQHVVQVHEMYEDPARGISSMRMEYIHGVSLWNWMSWSLRSGTFWSVSTCVAIGIQLTAGLVELESQGVVHADIKPENLMIEHDGRLVICDFGLAHLGEAALVPNGGSAHYMSPEIADGIYSARDVYAAGVILSQVLGNKCWSRDLKISEPELCKVVQSCYDADWRRRPFASDLLTSLKTCRKNCLPMSENDSQAVIAQQLKDDPPIKPSRIQAAFWAAEHDVRVAAAMAVQV
ncbi:Testis-specific serine/threonine-protein kinase 4, partial [Tulasnella sp. 331]